MAQSLTSLIGVPRRQHLEIAMIILISLAVTMNGENLDAVIDPDPTAEEFTIENHADADGRLSILYAFSFRKENWLPLATQFH